MLEKKIIVGLISIMEDKRLQVREDTVVLEDGVELSRTYTRYVMMPGDSIDNKPPEVIALANFLWTPEVIEAWKIKEVKLRNVLGSGVLPKLENNNG